MAENESNVTECPACGEGAVSFQESEELVEYGDGDTYAQIRVRVPKGSCASCGFEFTDRRAEELRHDAVCRHLQIHTSQEIQSLRKSMGLSRQAFSELTKIGEASLARWERGAGFQNPALDQLLHLLMFRDNVARLANRALKVDRSNVLRFPNLKDAEKTEVDANAFQLRPTGT